VGREGMIKKQNVKALKKTKKEIKKNPKKKRYELM